MTTHQDPPIPNTDQVVEPTTTPRTGSPDHGADALTDTGSHPALDVTVHERSAHHGSLDKVVFGVTAVIAVAFLIWGFLSTASLADVSGKSLTWTMENTGWLFVLTASGFVVFVLWLAMSRYGNITLGRDGEEPEFRTVSWIAMMFSAGMGIGLMFYGVSEPISHFMTPPPGPAPPATPPRRRPRWRPRSSTGPSTRGRSTPWWASRSRTAPTARAACS